MAKEEVEQTLISEKVKLRMSLKEIKTLINGVEKDGKVDTDELLKKVGRGPKREVMNMYLYLVKEAWLSKKKNSQMRQILLL